MASSKRKSYSDPSIPPEVRERRQVYDREAKRCARQTYLTEIDALNTTIVGLTQKLHALRGSSALPWKEVAEAMAANSASSATTNSRLRGQMEEQKQIARTLYEWAKAHLPTDTDEMTELEAMWLEVATLTDTGHVCREIGFSELQHFFDGYDSQGTEQVASSHSGDDES
ncbi:hypothetical protein SDRG_14891 [Saprolegnia diclina VS20]|uniref:Uncharacterized protein n=1 Tax=Saprolegnia diclina (strain VS20) TaxID=1156394 RepID=T0Q1L0_SAPDV|nr:hypothetical protein SDRG_14891 [Saprolegnia diclina VS20]EQC27270.1 hypothetical protein SDRG_14891 [Saprolegnia diclina VS20]|eukprot:XP_008619273.1 hypothetical protein SDRG_14891 [Saprolegnia diclina VS20]